MDAKFSGADAEAGPLRGKLASLGEPLIKRQEWLAKYKPTS